MCSEWFVCCCLVFMTFWTNFCSGLVNEEIIMANRVKIGFGVLSKQCLYEQCFNEGRSLGSPSVACKSLYNCGAVLADLSPTPSSLFSRIQLLAPSSRSSNFSNPKGMAIGYQEDTFPIAVVHSPSLLTS